MPAACGGPLAKLAAEDPGEVELLKDPKAVVMNTARCDTIAGIAPSDPRGEGNYNRSMAEGLTYWRRPGQKQQHFILNDEKKVANKENLKCLHD